MSVYVVITKISDNLPRTIAINHSYSIAEITNKFSEMEKECQYHSLKGEVYLNIYQGKEGLYSDSMVIGEGIGEEWISYVETRLLKLFPERKGEIDSVITLLTDAYLDNKQVANEQIIDENTIVKPKNNKKGKPPRSLNKERVFFRKKNLFIALGLIVLIAFIGIGILGYQSLVKKQQEENYAMLMEKEHYLKAAEDYPDKREEIESYLFVRADTINLQEFVAQYPSDIGQFNLAFLQKDWNGVVENVTENVQMTEERQAMLAFSYLKIGDLDKAREMNETLESAELTRMISNYQLYQNTLKKFEKQLEQDGVSEDEKADIQSNIQALKDQINTIGE